VLGVLGKILALPISLPAAGIRYCLEKVAEVAEAELWDDGPVREQLMLLQLQLEDGEIDEMEYRRREAPILIRLREIKERRREQIEADLAAQLTEGARREAVIDLPDEIR
jgi:hypothetical protein